MARPIINHYASIGIDVFDRDSSIHDISLKEIERAYKKAAKKHHPDKGGDIRKFEAAQSAIETLRDEAKRSKHIEELERYVREQRRLQAQDLHTKRMRTDLERREQANSSRVDNASSSVNWRESRAGGLVQATRSRNIKTFTYEEHLERESRILAMARAYVG